MTNRLRYLVADYGRQDLFRRLAAHIAEAEKEATFYEGAGAASLRTVRWHDARWLRKMQQELVGPQAGE